MYYMMCLFKYLYSLLVLHRIKPRRARARERERESNQIQSNPIQNQPRGVPLGISHQRPDAVIFHNVKHPTRMLRPLKPFRRVLPRVFRDGFPPTRVFVDVLR